MGDGTSGFHHYEPSCHNSNHEVQGHAKLYISRDSTPFLPPHFCPLMRDIGAHMSAHLKLN